MPSFSFTDQNDGIGFLTMSISCQWNFKFRDDRISWKAWEKLSPLKMKWNLELPFK